MGRVISINQQFYPVNNFLLSAGGVLDGTNNTSCVQQMNDVNTPQHKQQHIPLQIYHDDKDEEFAQSPLINHYESYKENQMPLDYAERKVCLCNFT